MSTPVTIANRALARLGEGQISSFEDDSDAAEKVNLLYEVTVQSLLSSHDWTFARRKVALVEDGATTPVTRWTRAFLMPVDRTDRVGKPRRVFNSTAVHAMPIQAYEINDRWILTNETICVIEYLKRLPESQWPGYFENLVIEALAAALALPITENASKEEFHRALAYGSPGQRGRGGMFGSAAESDQLGDPTIGLLDEHDPITSARFGGLR